jgi:DNA-binding MarR family transcriptional regulator
MADVQALGRRIKQVQYRHHRAIDARLAAVGTTLAQWDALRAIGRLPGASAHTLAIETFQSDQAFGTLANRLEAQGLIERRPGHGRRIEHRLTPAGEAMLTAGHPVASSVLAASFGGLSDEERATLLDLLLRIAGEDVG